MTPSQLQILQHALGVDRYGQGKRYRSHFCTGPECNNWDDCQALVAADLMQEHKSSQLSGGNSIFTVTGSGVLAMITESPAPPKLTRSQKRYQEWLDADNGMTFCEFIKAYRER